MNRSRRISKTTYAVAIAAVFVLAFVADLAAAELKRLAVIELPGPSGVRFDYLTIDYDDHYLFCAHLGVGNLYVVDSEDKQGRENDLGPSRRRGRRVRAGIEEGLHIRLA